MWTQRSADRTVWGIYEIYQKPGSGSESLNIIKNVIYIVGVFIGSICLSVSFDWSELTI